MKIDNFLILFLILFNCFIIFFFNKIKLFYINIDKPDNKRKLHKYPIPLAGGLIIIFNLTIYYIFVFNELELLKNEIIFKDYKNLTILVISSLLIFLVGFIDDRIDLKASTKFILISCIIFLTLIFDNSLIIKSVNFSFLSTNINLSYYSIFFTVFCFLVFLNALNMFDGINLQSGIYVIIILTGIILFYSESLFVKIILISILCYSYLNYKNKCFLGDSGSLLIAFLIGYLFIKFYNNSIIKFADEIVLYMLAPGADLIRLFFKRISLKRNPLTPDRFHLHHLLLLKYTYWKTLLILSFMIILPLVMNLAELNKLLIILIFLFIYSLLIYSTNKK